MTTVEVNTTPKQKGVLNELKWLLDRPLEDEIGKVAYMDLSVFDKVDSDKVKEIMKNCKIEFGSPGEMNSSSLENIFRNPENIDKPYEPIDNDWFEKRKICNEYGNKIQPETNKPHNDKHKGLRFNKGKLRYDLFHPYADEQLAKVFTMGAEKYAPRNWENGMSWTSVIASLKRHLAAIERGEDYDDESGLLHSAHVQWNAHVLSAYYKIYPQGDDRSHSYLNMPKIGLDIDEVLCDWVAPWCAKFGHGIPDSWNFSYKNRERLDVQTKELLEFYKNLPPKISPKDIPFEPHAYITSRSIPIELTKEWIEGNGFPTAKVYSVPFGESKVDVAKQSGIDIFVDDNFGNFVELNKAGICTYLLDAPHNQRYQVGYKRIKSLKELYERFK